MVPHILIVDDDKRINILLAKFLSENNFLPTTVKNAFEALEAVHIFLFDLLIIDINMPVKSGLELTNDIRKFSLVPIIMLTAKHEVHDRIIGLEMGADDYLSKPFEPKELLLRMHKILSRKSDNTYEETRYFGNITFDISTNKIYKRKQEVSVTTVEMMLFNFLTDNRNNIITREKIANFLNINERSVDVFITRLRSKIEDDSKNPRYLRTIRGKGYGLFL